MAARVNVRFLLVLIIVLGAVLGGAGAYFLLQEQSAEDHMAKAEELIAGGALKPALQQLEAAIGKDPTNRGSLQQLADLHTRIVPRSRSEAFELFPKVMVLASHYSIYFPDDPDVHRRSIASHRAAIRSMGEVQAQRRYWDTANDAAERLMEIEDDPDAVAHGTAVHGQWLAAPVRGVDLGADRTESQRDEGLTLLRDALAGRPDDDRLRAAYLDALRGVLVLRVEEDASERLREEAISGLVAGLEDAEAALATQPDEIAGTAIRTRSAIAEGRRQVALLREQASEAARSAGRGIEAAEEKASQSLELFRLATRELRSVAERWAESVDIVPDRNQPLEGGVSPDEYLRLVAEALGPISLLTMLGTEYSAVGLAERVMARPEVATSARALAIDLAARMAPARSGGSGTEARDAVVADMIDAIDRALAIEPQPMGVDALLAMSLRRRALAAAVEAELFAWESADEGSDEQAMRVAKMRERQGALEQEIAERGGDPDEAPDALYGRGLVAFASGDTTAAASSFQQVVGARTTQLDRFQEMVSLRLLARTLEDEGALARAAQAHARVLAFLPDHVQTLARLARVELRRGRPAQAESLTNRLAELIGETNQVSGLRRAIAVARGDETDDPVATAIARMQRLEEDGDVDAAMVVAEELVSGPPASNIADVHLIIGDLALRAGRRDRAMTAFQRADELAPDNPRISARLTMMRTEDPLEQSIEVAEAAIDDPAERAVRLADSFETRVQVLEASIAATDDEEARAELAVQRDRFAAAAREQENAARDAMGPGASATAVILWMDRLLRQAETTDDWSDAEQFLADVRQGDLDRAGGSFAEGQLMLARASTSEGPERQAFYEQAVAALDEAVDLLPFSEEAGRRLGAGLRELGRLEDAERAFADAFANAPGDPGLALQYAQVLTQKGELALASEVLAAALQRSPDNQRLREVRLGIELQRGNDGVVLLDRRRIHDRNASDLDNAMRYAYLLLNTMPAYATMVDDEGRPMLSPGQWARLGPVGQRAQLQAVRRGWIDEARAIIADVESRLGAEQLEAALSLDLLRAMAAEASGDADGAVGIMRAAVDSAEGEMLRPTIGAAASLLVKFRRMREAYDLLLAQQERIGESPDPMVAWTISQVLQEAGRPDLAFPELRAAQAAADGEAISVFAPRFSELRMEERTIEPASLTRQIVQLILRGGDVADARRIWEESNPEDMRANQFVELAILAREADAARLAGDETTADTIDARFESIAEELTAAAPEDPSIWGLRVERYLQRNRIEGRVELLDLAQETLTEGQRAVSDPTALSPANRLVLVARGNLAGLARELEGLLEERPTDQGIRGQLINTYESLGRLEDAERILRAGIDLAGMSERSLAWRQQLARLLMNQEKYEQATEAYAEAMGIAGEGDLDLLRQWLLARLAGETPQHRQVSNVLAEREADMVREPLLRAIYARCLQQLSRDAPAEAQYVQSLAAIKQGIAEGTVRVSDSAAWVQQVLDGQDDGLTAGEARVRRLADGELDAWMLLALAQRWAGDEEGNFRRAVELLEQAVARVPDGPSAPVQRSVIRKVLGGVLIGSGRPEDALDVYEQALADTPRDADLLNNTAFLQATLVGDAEGALPRALAAVARQPDNWAFLDTAGKICSLLGRWEDAEAYLERSIAARPDAKNMLHLAEVQAATDRRDEALRTLERASELRDPDDDETRAEIRQLADELAGG